MTEAVLAVNAGSSSLKFGLYPRQGAALWTGQIEGLEAAGEAAFSAALQRLLHDCTQRGARLLAVAHRIVHGGEAFIAPCRLDAAALQRLRALAPLAPLHQPHNLDGVAAFLQALPQLPQVGCFDTAFHATLPAVERALPTDRALAAQGLRRYGFHGLSYQYLAQTLPQHSARAGGRVLLAHLGNGASLCALRGGRSVATTMGFSALEGLMMGTRSGSLDPGVLLHLLRQGWSADALEDLLYRRSGLKGVSGLSADMRTLRASTEPAAAEAIALFTHRCLREAGALAAVLGGLDAIAFTGGIGEHDAALRAELAAGLAHLGVRLDPSTNSAARGDRVAAIHAADSAVELWVVPTDEGRVAAQAAFSLLDA
ncbi:acetate/propionate family kinase [Ideonella alba]|uniref:Acetate kinase n=1 Tax=Ideonella alba TaxID=2824118 RepID=A0A941BMU8_9BURK|nr:acetate kinase [Ideonella alba]MBQ0932644.1 acetate kinase [Ideonella alba]